MNDFSGVPVTNSLILVSSALTYIRAYDVFFANRKIPTFNAQIIMTFV